VVSDDGRGARARACIGGQALVDAGKRFELLVDYCLSKLSG
jgi:hypothetical protein